MKRNLQFAFLAFIAAGSAQTQNIVGTEQTLRNGIIEEFSGINCVNCPNGHTTLENILSSNAGRVFALQYAPTNSSYTSPGSNGGTDFRRSYLDAFYTGSYCSPSSGSRYMPSAFINRVLGSNGDILQSTGAWSNMVAEVILQPSPMNVGAKSVYDATAQTLTIDLEVYYTEDITDGNSFYVSIVEDDLTSDYQSGSTANASNPYVYKHTFRENLTGQWGDPVTGSTTVGSLFTKQIVFDLSTAEDPIDVANAHIAVYVIEDVTTEIYSGISIAADGGEDATSTVGIEDELEIQSLSVYPNPATSELNIVLNQDLGNEVNLTIIDLTGKVIYNSLIPNTGQTETINLESLNIAAGSYILNINSESHSISQSLIVE